MLTIVLCLVQYKLWWGHNGVFQLWEKRRHIEQQESINQSLIERNKMLMADVSDLKKGMESIEERARNELGLIQEGETFYRIITTNKKHEQ
ncbi:cell division protein FtsB [Algicola sagamiensis]|uniref:cell division protein FtsB n=1 Tax=Algicola sagamiensis TaxID=163869 RepID=UPI001FE22772|nr:cell division protein FtsB [Algicola sagamiensis]